MIKKEVLALLSSAVLAFSAGAQVIKIAPRSSGSSSPRAVQTPKRSSTPTPRVFSTPRTSPPRIQVTPRSYTPQTPRRTYSPPKRAVTPRIRSTPRTYSIPRTRSIVPRYTTRRPSRPRAKPWVAPSPRINRGSSGVRVWRWKNPTNNVSPRRYVQPRSSVRVSPLPLPKKTGRVPSSYRKVTAPRSVRWPTQVEPKSTVHIKPLDRTTRFGRVNNIRNTSLEQPNIKRLINRIPDNKKVGIEPKVWRRDAPLPNKSNVVRRIRGDSEPNPIPRLKGSGSPKNKGSFPPRKPPSFNGGSRFWNKNNGGARFANQKNPIVPRLGIKSNYKRYYSRVIPPNQEYFTFGVSYLYYKPRRYFSFHFGLSSWWWSLRWFHCGFSPWFASWDWCWNWSPWWYRHYWLTTYYYPMVYVPYYCIRYVPYYVWSGASWYFEYSLPYFYFWVNQIDSSDGWYSPYTSRITIEYNNCSSDDSNDEIQEVSIKSNRKPDSTVEIAGRYVKLGDAYFEDGRYLEAADSYLRALAYAPNSPSVYFALADSLFAAGDYHYAAYEIRKGITMDESLAKTKIDKRTFYKDPKEFIKQMERLEKWIAQHPKDSDAWLVLGYNRYFSGDKKGAKDAFMKVADMVPGDRASAIFLKELI